MSTVPRTGPNPGPELIDKGSLTPRTDRQEGRPRAKPLLRRYEAACLGDGSEILDISRLGPAIPLFESAFGAFARGTLIATPGGPVAVEDLRPGDLLETAESGPQRLLWCGQMTHYPARPGMDMQRDGLVRITADALGYGRPMQDLLLGPDARIWSPRRDGFVRPGTLVDGETVLALTPVAAVTLHHLCLAGAPTLMACGLAAASFAADAVALSRLTAEMLELFLSLFPTAALRAELDLPLAGTAGAAGTALRAHRAA